ncbi:hypothetical protein PLEOSDRAFT_1094786 [Pleurotus ostreatus PC15]|uniref:Protein kinase domain-containing protein n=1 Tax=Pleurotus ostreatus (strain PC15) TaxID=1137138 RepID=A0A067N5I7_PLEO1|nr:hypothetical protein PLEOSDRAFT_1094786 [Pleurotus ostreatus PC15]
MLGHKHSTSVTQNLKAHLATAYNELGKELSSNKIRVVGNYTLGKVIGEGAYGKVRLGTHRLTSTRVAIKQIPKAMSSYLTREIHHHRQLHHPHVTQMYEVIATEANIWIVTELCCGGELFDYLAEKGRLSEEETRVIFGQLCLAVAYLHEKGIVHRDLKLENVLLDERCRVKLGDFGFTREFERGSLMETFCGTTGYASPEMLQGKKYQGPEVDVWSLGVILYCLLTGTLPFDDDDESVMKSKIIKGDFEDPVWLSLESRQLFKGILEQDTSIRMTIPQILAHPWFTVKEFGYEQPEQPTPSPIPVAASNSGSGSNSKAQPPSYPLRTPARTKRRSVSSTLSDPGSPTAEKLPSPLPLPQSHDINFSSLLSTPAPIIFSTPQERDLLNGMSTLGFDTAQIVHSVLSDACDAASAVWWMLMKKAERKALEGDTPNASGAASGATTDATLGPKKHPSEHRRKRKTTVGVQTDEGSPRSLATLNRSAPQLAFVPPTPTLARNTTPPLPSTPTRSSMLSPSPSIITGESSRSHPSTPASSLKDKENSKARKNRSGSVSIMQRATTALEAAGLVRKKSSEGVGRDDKEKEKAVKETEKRPGSGDEPRSSQASSSKLTKSPPHKVSRDNHPSTPELRHPQPQIGSPWVFAGSPSSRQDLGAPTPANSPGDMKPAESGSQGKGNARNRASILSTFRLWFNEERKGKRKEVVNPPKAPSTPYRQTPAQGKAPSFGTGKRRRSGSGGYAGRSGHRPHRPSVSSRRSSSVNSRRSSVASIQPIHLDSPQIPNRPSLGSHTPNSERGDHSSRPSSIRSFTMQRHRKSPSASSAGSIHYRGASPMSKYHRRAGSGGSSTTRVVRQIHSNRPPHVRSNSTTSSIHSPASSRPASWYDPSDVDMPRTASPMKASSRRLPDDGGSRRYGSSTKFIAQKRQAPFMSPGASYSGSIGRSSWKKSWGLEPPGWQTRTTHIPVEVLTISPTPDGSGFRDVITGRHSLNLGDESDWVDEDDDLPAFAGGLGQMPTSLAMANSAFAQSMAEPVVTLNTGKRNNNRNNAGGLRPKTGHSPVERVSPIPMDNQIEPRGGRRQLPGRAGPSFRGNVIQEVDEDEEEEE